MKKILVLEKNKDILELINIILSDAGYLVDLVSEEKDIYDHIKAFQPDVILLDVIQPSPEGTAICESLKAAEETNHIPVIVLSTHPRAQVMKEICADEVINKPFDISFLVAVIEEYALSA